MLATIAPADCVAKDPAPGGDSERRMPRLRCVRRPLPETNEPLLPERSPNSRTSQPVPPTTVPQLTADVDESSGDESPRAGDSYQRVRALRQAEWQHAVHQNPLPQPPRPQRMIEAALGTTLAPKYAAVLRGRREADIPTYFKCSLSKQLMTDPVMTCEGHSYERRVWMRWLDTCRENGWPTPTNPVTGQPLRSWKVRDNKLLRFAINKRAQWCEQHRDDLGDPKTTDWYCIMPPSATRPFCEPVTLSSSDTFEKLQLLKWVDGRAYSVFDPHRKLKHRELMVPNLAVAAMVQDAGYEPCIIAPLIEKITIYSRKPVWSCDETAQVYVTGALMGALLGAGCWLPAFSALGMNVVPAAFPAVSLGGACAGGTGAAVGASCFQRRAKDAEAERLERRPQFGGP